MIEKEASALRTVCELLKDGLVFVESEFNHFMIYRPASVDGTKFWVSGHQVSNSSTGDAYLATNAPPGYLRPAESDSWAFTIHLHAAPGPGPTWFDEQFPTVEEAIEAVRGCYFGEAIDFTQPELQKWIQSST